MLISVKHILQKVYDIFLKALNGKAYLAAVVIWEDEHIYQHAHGKADGRIPKALHSVGNRLDSRRDAQQHHYKAGQRRGKTHTQAVIQGDDKDDAYTHRRKVIDGQQAQNYACRRAEKQPHKLGKAGHDRVLEGGHYRRHCPQHGENQLGVAAAAVVIHQYHGEGYSHSGFYRAQAYMESGVLFVHK